MVEGKVINQKTDEPIAYANVGIPGKYIGMATNQEGVFKLKLPAGTRSDTLQISAIGFETLRMEVADFSQRNRSTISLQPKTYELNSITVSGKKELETEWIGKEKFGFFGRLFGVGSGAYGEAGYGDNLGASYAFKINWDKELPIRIIQAKMFLRRNDNENPIKFRCRLKSVNPKTGRPDKDLMHQNVISNAEDKGWIGCNFPEQEAYIELANFFIVFEWLRSESSSQIIAPMFSIDRSLHPDIYVRRKAMGRWKKLSHDLIYGIEVEY